SGPAALTGSARPGQHEPLDGGGTRAYLPTPRQQQWHDPDQSASLLHRSQVGQAGVLIQLDAEKHVFHVIHEGKTVKELPIRGLLPATMYFQAYLRVMKEEAGQIARYRQMQWENVGDPPY